jgi:O-antigen/teichoic acid export membrane protein
MLVAFPEQVLRVWGGATLPIGEIAPVLRIYVLGTALNCLMQMPYLAQLAHGRTRLTVKVNIWMLALIVPSTIAIVLEYGTVGAAVVWFGLNLVYLVVVAPLFHRQILAGEIRAWYLQDLGLPALAGAAAAAGMSSILATIDVTGRFQLLLCLGFTGILVAAAVVAANGHLRLGAIDLVRTVRLPRVKQLTGRS